MYKVHNIITTRILHFQQPGVKTCILSTCGVNDNNSSSSSLVVVDLFNDENNNTVSATSGVVDLTVQDGYSSKALPAVRCTFHKTVCTF